MQVDVLSFLPVPAGTLTLAASVTTARVQFNQANRRARKVRVYNAGTVDAFIEFGDVTVVAVVATSMCLKAGTSEIFAAGTATHLAAILGSATANIYVTPGDAS